MITEEEVAQKVFKRLLGDSLGVAWFYRGDFKSHSFWLCDWHSEGMLKRTDARYDEPDKRTTCHVCNGGKLE